MASHDLLRVASRVLEQLRELRAELPARVSLVRRLKAPPTNTGGYSVKLGTANDHSLDIALWLDRFPGRVRYYAGFESRTAEPVRWIERAGSRIFGAAELVTEDDLIYDSKSSLQQLAPRSRKNVYQRPVLEMYPTKKSYFYGQYYPFLPNSPRAEGALVDAILKFLRPALSAGSRGRKSGRVDLTDARKRMKQAIVQRQGQGAFRRRILRAYRSRCAVTRSAAKQVLEAAHITPYLGKHTDRTTNGLLLRSDIHTLFDLGLLGIDPRTLSVVLSPKLDHTEYATYAGKRIGLPAFVGDHPSPAELRRHLRRRGLAAR